LDGVEEAGPLDGVEEAEPLDGEEENLVLETEEETSEEDIVADFPNVLTQEEDVLDMGWGEWYERCPEMSLPWHTIQNTHVWPEGFSVSQDGRYMFYRGLRCVPRDLLPYVVRDHHEHTGHTGVVKLVESMSRYYRMSEDKATVTKLAAFVVKHCYVCQAYKPANTETCLKMKSTPIPCSLGDSMAIDVFHMPKVVQDGKAYDCFILAVDRHSGFTVVEPALELGLTSVDVAKLIFPKWIEIFGVPSVITSDKGAHFASHFWKSLCNLMGIRAAYSHAHYHQGNGKAERTGRELKDWMSRFKETDDRNWVECLPVVRQLYHDTPGITGFSPYEIVYGRTRHDGGVPFGGVQAQAATEFMDVRRRTWEYVQSKLQTVQRAHLEALNKKRKEPPVYVVGDWVWYKHPPDRSSAQHPAYTGPYILKKRLGDNSWLLFSGIREFTGHASWIKRYWGPVYGGRRIPLAHEKVSRPSTAENGEQEYGVEKIMKHRTYRGELQFLTRWKGFREEDDSWEPVKSFIHRYNSELVKYVKDQGLGYVPVLDYLSSEPSGPRTPKPRRR